jgi:predicted PurR-regulated permease PerM
VTAIASWPLYRRFADRLTPRIGHSATSLIFTCLVVVFVLGPLLFAFAALLHEANVLVLQIAAADKKGMAVPVWLESVPLAGPWIVARWQSELAHAGALSVWALRMDPGAMLGWAHSIGQFMLRHLFIVAFTILGTFFLYEEGEELAEGFRNLLRQHISERADLYVGLATRALRASVNSMLVVGLFDGFATAVAYAIAGVPQVALWAAITGAFALVPFLGYAAVTALALQLAMTGATTAALLSFALGCGVLFCGDKIVRPVVARDGTRLHFVWILMGCLGGFETLGLVGLVIGPVLLALTRELWKQRARESAVWCVAAATSPVDRSA